MPEAACALLKAWVAAAGLTAAAKPYVFVLGRGRGGGGGIGPAGHAQPVADKRWTEVVQGVLKRHSGVAMAPKDLRASFITFPMSDANTDEQLKKAVAHAMRHSVAMQQGAAYDKENVRVASGPPRSRWRATTPPRRRRSRRESRGRARVCAPCERTHRPHTAHWWTPRLAGRRILLK